MIFFADNSKRLQPIDSLSGFGDTGGRGGLWNINMFAVRDERLPPVGGGRVGSAPVQQASVPPIDFDFDLSQIQRAIAKGNTEADVKSAYEVFTTGQRSKIPGGRGFEYAQDVQRRFGAPSIRHAAASYLDAAGLPRLARIVSPGPTQPPQDPDDLGDFFGLPVVPDPAQAAMPEKKNPVDLLIDALPRLFGQAVYNPPLQSQATGYTPVTGDFGGAQQRGGIGMWLLLGAAAIAAYFIYKRYSG